MDLSPWKPIICQICEHSIYCQTENWYRCTLRHCVLIPKMEECEDFKRRRENSIWKDCTCASCREKDAEVDRLFRRIIPICTERSHLP